MSRPVLIETKKKGHYEMRIYDCGVAEIQLTCLRGGGIFFRFDDIEQAKKKWASIQNTLGTPVKWRKMIPYKKHHIGQLGTPNLFDE
jgi:hypothetical protein